MSRRRKVLPLIRWAFIVLIAVAATSLAINFVWFSDTVRERTRLARLGQALLREYQELHRVKRGGRAIDPAVLAARRSELAVRSENLALLVATSSRRAVHALAAVAVSSFGTVVAGVAIMVFVNRRLTRPLNLLLEATQRFAAGEVGVRVPYERGDEMGALVAAFNEMAKRLERTLRQLENERATLEARVRAATAELRALTLTDEMTGLPNLRHLREEFAKLAERSAETKSPFLFVAVDAEGLKEFNETFGREAGNLVLIAIARCLRAAAREGDFVARYGGVRFAILMPGLTALPARFVERVEDDLASIGRLIKVRTDRPVQLRLSVGVARFPTDGESLQALAMAAGRDLLRNRERAGGRAAVASPLAAAREVLYEGA